MRALAAALRTVLNDPNLGSLGTYYPERGGVPGLNLRVAIRNPDQLLDAVQTTTVIPDVVITCSADDLSSVQPGGVFVVEDDEYEVLANVKGDRGTRLQIPSRKLAPMARARRLLEEASE